MLSGKHYNNATRVYKYIYDAMRRLEIESFESWLIERGELDVFVDFWSSSELAEVVKDINFDTFKELKLKHNRVFELIEEFEKSLVDKHQAGPVATFWFSFLQMMNTLFAFIRSVRQGDWTSHLQATQLMLPWMFAYDRPNYSRFLTYYWAEMKELPQTHPEIYGAFW